MYIGGSEFTSIMDKTCIEKYGIPEIILMENAATKGFERIESIVEKDKSKKFIVVCGCGNNGGDGFAISRKLYNEGYDVSVFVIGNIEKMSSSTKTNYEIIKSIGIDINTLEKETVCNENTNLYNKLANADVVLDCIFGVGLNRNIEGSYKTLIEKINYTKEDSGYKVISIDIPSGVNGTTGVIMGVSIVADCTITFEFYKKGFLRYETEKYLGNVFTEKIGIPYKFYNEILPEACFIDKEYVLDNLILKEKYSHKGDFGKVVMFAGSNGYYGAAYLSTSACVATGSGLTTLVCNEDVQNIVAVKLNEAMTCLYSDTKKMDRLYENADAIGIGPGLGNTADTKRLLKKVIDTFSVPIVIDADGINEFDAEMLNDDSRCIITPHIGEFSRLTKVPIEEIQKDRIKYAQKFAEENNIIVVLKGKNTIVTDGVRTMVNTTGNQAMANGGMGDTLTGIIVSLCGQGYDEFTASAIGVYLHGACGDKVYEENQVVSASDLIKMIPKYLKIMYNEINEA